MVFRWAGGVRLEPGFRPDLQQLKPTIYHVK